MSIVIFHGIINQSITLNVPSPNNVLVCLNPSTMSGLMNMRAVDPFGVVTCPE